MRKKFLLIISIVVIFALPLSGCKQNKKQNVYQAVKTSKTINWGGKADTPLFGSINIKQANLMALKLI